MDNMEITIERLEKARRQYFLMKDIQEELSQAYNTYHSPQMNSIRTDSGKSDPTGNAVMRIEGMREKYDLLLDRFLEYQLFVMDGISDPVIRAVINQYYFAGRSWRETMVHNARKKVIEYLKRNERTAEDEC